MQHLKIVISVLSLLESSKVVVTAGNTYQGPNAISCSISLSGVTCYDDMQVMWINKWHFMQLNSAFHADMHA